ncbi:hypothetical protein, partial [Lentilactobacillus hilgardii]|uniref:hypothetical protein n=1 Tax=Lentilactobacillus hilgardii TaxID=1588 RepID=UPI0039EB2011
MLVFSDKFNLTDRSHFFTQWVKKAAAQIINLIGSAASFYFFRDYLGKILLLLISRVTLCHTGIL